MKNRLVCIIRNCLEPKSIPGEEGGVSGWTVDGDGEGRRGDTGGGGATPLQSSLEAGFIVERASEGSIGVKFRE